MRDMRKPFGAKGRKVRRRGEIRRANQEHARRHLERYWVSSLAGLCFANVSVDYRLQVDTAFLFEDRRIRPLIRRALEGFTVQYLPDDVKQGTTSPLKAISG